MNKNKKNGDGKGTSDALNSNISVKLSNGGVVGSPIEMFSIIDKKIQFFQDIIQKTLLYVQKNKILDVLTSSDVNSCIDILHP